MYCQCERVTQPKGKAIIAKIREANVMSWIEYWSKLNKIGMVYMYKNMKISNLKMLLSEYNVTNDEFSLFCNKLYDSYCDRCFGVPVFGYEVVVGNSVNEENIKEILTYLSKGKKNVTN